MSWIRIISYEEATGKLKTLYERIKGPNNAIDNIMRVHSLRPHSLEGHIVLYKNVLHHTANKLPTWLLETVGIYVSLLNRCQYCVDHHYAGLRRLLKDNVRASTIFETLQQKHFEHLFTERETAMFRYAEQLTVHPAEMQEASIHTLRAVGLDDGEILELNQVVSYFAYANRTVLGLGVTTQGDVLGLSPQDSNDSSSWQHR